jgi:chromosome segregation ATPase
MAQVRAQVLGGRELQDTAEARALLGASRRQQQEAAVQLAAVEAGHQVTRAALRAACRKQQAAEGQLAASEAGHQATQAALEAARTNQQAAEDQLGASEAGHQATRAALGGEQVRLQKSVSSLEAELVHCWASMEGASEAASKLRGSLAAAERQRDEAGRKADEADARAAKALKLQGAAQEQKQATVTRLMDLKGREKENLGKSEKALVGLKADHKAVMQEAEEQLASSQGRLQAAQGELEAAKGEVHALRDSLSAAEARAEPEADAAGKHMLLEAELLQAAGRTRRAEARQQAAEQALKTASEGEKAMQARLEEVGGELKAAEKDVGRLRRLRNSAKKQRDDAKLELAAQPEAPQQEVGKLWQLVEAVQGRLREAGQKLEASEAGQQATTHQLAAAARSWRSQRRANKPPHASCKKHNASCRRQQLCAELSGRGTGWQRLRRSSRCRLR